MPNNGMYRAIEAFPQQFAFVPTLEHEQRLPARHRFLVAGMGGSHLAADVLQAWKPTLPLTTHRDYGLPPLSDEDVAQTLLIASSYSGNTEEVLDAYTQGRERGLAVAVISVGGKLLKRAQEDGVPYVQLPDTGIQPRSALGYGVKALLRILGEDEGTEEAEGLVTALDVATAREEGSRLAEILKGKVPVIYASTRNLPIAYNWKIKLNETGKIPAFCNVVPELNHNEMTGFDAQGGTKALAQLFHWIFLTDDRDHPSNKKRMEVLAGLFADRSLTAHQMPLTGMTAFARIFSSLLVADWCAYCTAELYGVEAEQVPMVEEFKKLIG